MAEIKIGGVTLRKEGEVWAVDDMWRPNTHTPSRDHLFWTANSLRGAIPMFLGVVSGREGDLSVEDQEMFRHLMEWTATTILDVLSDPEWLDHEIDLRGWTKKDLHERSGVGYSTIKRVGKEPIGTDNLLKILEALT